MMNKLRMGCLYIQEFYGKLCYLPATILNIDLVEQFATIEIKNKGTSKRIKKVPLLHLRCISIETDDPDSIRCWINKFNKINCQYRSEFCGNVRSHPAVILNIDLVEQFVAIKIKNTETKCKTIKKKVPLLYLRCISIETDGPDSILYMDIDENEKKEIS